MAMAMANTDHLSTRVSRKPSFRITKVRFHGTYCTCGRTVTVTQRRCSIESNASDQQDPPCHKVFNYLTPVLLATVAVRYQGKATDPFETHPVNMWTFVTTICIYYLLVGMIKGMNGNQGQSRYYLIFSRFSLVNGALSSVALASILLPRLLGGVMFVLWVLVTIMVARHLIVCIYTTTTSFAVDKYNWIKQKFVKEPGTLPC